MSETVYGGNRVKQLPKAMTCGHVPDVHFTKSGKYVVICTPRYTCSEAFTDIDPNVWCGQGCGWVDITDHDYEYYREFDGTQEPNRTNPER